MHSTLSDFARKLRREIGAFKAEHKPGVATFPFEDRAFLLFALQFELNPDYRLLCESRGVSPMTVQCWQQIPAIPTTAFKELPLSCIPSRARTAYFESSGTSRRIRGRHWHHAESLALYSESLLQWFEACRRPDPHQPSMIILTPPPAAVPHSSLVFMFDALRRRWNIDSSTFLGELSDDAWTLDRARVHSAFQRATESNHPVAVFGTAFSFVQLLDDFATRSVRHNLPEKSWVLETGGYKGRSRAIPKVELHALITHHLGVPEFHIFSEYGMSELSSQAYDRLSEPGAASQRHFLFPPWARSRVISPETGTEVRDGETGLLQVFDLANAFSVLAIQTEDLATRRGDGFELRGRATSSEPRGCSLQVAGA